MTTRRVFLFEYLSALPVAAGDADAAALRAEGVAMRDALAAALAAVPGVALSVADGAADIEIADTVPPLAATNNPPASGQPRGIQWLRAQTGESPTTFVARQAQGHDFVWVIAPETGGLLAALHAVVPPHQWVGCDGEAIRLASLKRATLQHLQAHGIATPLDFEADASVRHWVVKPDDGAGSLHTQRHADRAAAEADRDRRGQQGELVTLEPWVEGDALSASLQVHRHGVEVLALNRQRLHIDGEGAVSLHAVDVAVTGLTPAQHQAIEHLAVAVCAAVPGLAGWVGLDLVWHAERGPVLIEINPRLTSACVGLFARRGASLAAVLLADHMEAHADAPTAAHTDTHAATTAATTADAVCLPEPP